MNMGIVRMGFVVVLIVACGALAAPAALHPAFASVGFGVSVPAVWPIAWGDSFSFVTLEALLSPHVTTFFDLGTYPAEFPNLFEGSSSLLVKSWIGPASLYAGAGLSVRARRVGSVWSYRPLLALRAGCQLWLLEPLAFHLQFRSLDPFPLQWTFSPEVSLGFSVGLGRATPDRPAWDFDYLWLITGLAVAAVVAFLPRQ